MLFAVRRCRQIILILGFLLPSLLLAAKQPAALILHDGPANSGEGMIAAREAANLMGHFGYAATVLAADRYSAGQAAPFQAVFVVGMDDKSVIPAPLLADLARREETTCWINQCLGQLTANPAVAERLGFTCGESDDDTGLDTVKYRGFALPKTDEGINHLRILDPKKTEVLATASTGKESEPFVVRSGRFW